MGMAVSYYLFTGQAGQFVLPRHVGVVMNSNMGGGVH